MICCARRSSLPRGNSSPKCIKMSRKVSSSTALLTFTYYITVHQQMPSSFIQSHRIYRLHRTRPQCKCPLRVHCPLWNPLNNLRLFLQTLLPSSDLLWSKSTCSSSPWLSRLTSVYNFDKFPFTYLSLLPFWLPLWRTYISQATDSFRQNKWSGGLLTFFSDFSATFDNK